MKNQKFSDAIDDFILFALIMVWFFLTYYIVSAQ